ncbi:hypothetical protein ACFQ51_29975 [Streptomyces kaempferi]
MNTRIRYGGLGLLAVTGMYTGVWAYFSPKGWYAHFPGFGLSSCLSWAPTTNTSPKTPGPCSSRWPC